MADVEPRRHVAFWDAADETAWVAEPTTAYHEQPSRRLTALMDRIAVASDGAVLRAALACRDEADFLARLRRRT